MTHYMLHNSTKDEWLAEDGGAVSGGNFGSAKRFDALDDAHKAALDMSESSPWVIVVWRVGRDTDTDPVTDFIHLVYGGRIWEPVRKTQ